MHLPGRVILSACSPYFHAMFTSELLEARQTEVPIRDIDEHAVDLLVNFCYTSEITIEESNVQTLLPAGESAGLLPSCIASGPSNTIIGWG